MHRTPELGGEGLVSGLVGHARIDVEVTSHNSKIRRGALHQLHNLLGLQLKAYDIGTDSQGFTSLFGIWIRIKLAS